MTEQRESEPLRIPSASEQRVEHAPFPERGGETEPRPESDQSRRESAPESHAPTPPAHVPPPPARPKSERLRQIESVLSDGLASSYASLPPELQKEFKRKGEETASAIEMLLTKTKVKVKKVIALIMDWLKLLPGVSKYFLEQEAKIKTDTLLAMKRDGEEH